MGDTTVADLYAAGLERHLALADELTDEDAELPTPACPEWRVKDVYAHLAGLCSDVVEGRVEGAGTDEWTGRQVEARRDLPFADIVAELRERGPQLVEALRAFPIERIVIDQWIHEQDVRAAVGRPGNRDVPVVPWAVGLMVDGLDKRWRKEGRPPVRVETTSATFTMGEGEPVATLQTDDFELMRAVLGRRSPAQVRAMVVDGDPSAVDGLAVFGPRTDDLVE
jgi:uncharacterized protein (TIGR03083 family)